MVIWQELPKEMTIGNMGIVRDSIDNIIASQKIGTTIKLKEKALFKTKVASDTKYNGQIVDVIAFTKGKDIYNSRYTVKFNDN